MRNNDGKKSKDYRPKNQKGDKRPRRANSEKQKSSNLGANQNGNASNGNGEVKESPPEKPENNGQSTSEKGGGLSGASAKKPKGIVSASEFAQYKFEYLELSGDWSFLKPPKNFHQALYGNPKNGKTAMALQQAMHLTQHGQVLYDFADQKLSATTQDLILNLGADKANGLDLAQYDTLEELEQVLNDNPQYQFIYLDLIHDFSEDPDKFSKFTEKFSDRSFTAVFETTKRGAFKGPQKWMHNADIIGQAVDYFGYFWGRCGNGEFIIWDKEAKKRDPEEYDRIVKEKQNTGGDSSKYQDNDKATIISRSKDRFSNETDAWNNLKKMYAIDRKLAKPVHTNEAWQWEVTI